MPLWAWILFYVLVLIMLLADLKMFAKKGQHEVSISEALKMTAVWIGVSLIFCAGIYIFYPIDPHEKAMEFLAGYLIEKSLSMDNLFVFLMLFSFFGIKRKYQHEVLFWGIVGALVFRGVMIILGAALVNRFSWVMYVFGVLLIISALKMLFGKDDEFDADKSVVIKLIRKIYAVSPELDEGKFFTTQNGVRAMTPLLVVLLVIESTDILFAVDSIPAVFSVTTDSFIVFTSNIFAILGLRSLYFVLSSLMSKFQYMKYSLFVLLVFIGVEMLLPAFVEVEIPILVSLSVIVVILGVGILVSILMNKKSGVDE